MVVGLSLFGIGCFVEGMGVGDHGSIVHYMDVDIYGLVNQKGSHDENHQYDTQLLYGLMYTPGHSYAKERK